MTGSRHRAHLTFVLQFSHVGPEFFFCPHFPQMISSSILEVVVFSVNKMRKKIPPGFYNKINIILPCLSTSPHQIRSSV
jgi:hypothetical protein